ncbi:hypothetical protein VNO77_32524 [Canavalia gladiata]|uniref:Uncharacterized protein n=1 Tax=Canavalia gladiata TaxID=3824 RepID=A0AAN9KSQ5_CANGL
MASRHLLLHRFRLHGFQGFTATAPQGHRFWCSATLSSEDANDKAGCENHTHSSNLVEDELEEEILTDIKPILMLTRNILHTTRYMSGERLTTEDERAVVDKLLVYHPHFEDKIGCGLESIMVDRHPHWYSRCFFVVRTDGSWTDFSYKICLQGYIRDRYQPNAERFIETRFGKNGFVRGLFKRWGI